MFSKDRTFPIKTKYSDGYNLEIGDDKNQNSANKHNPITINDKLIELVKIMHGSFESK